jgi:sterol desaturase/sphingolipid hydroxylase (fatty acid hydroxylase superfamily)
VLASYLTGMDAITWAASWKGGIIAVVFVSFFMLERVAPVAASIGGWHRVGRNLGVAALNFVASPLIVIPITAFAVNHAPHLRPDSWSGGSGLLVDLLILDCWIYWWHRINHQIPFLWRWHEVHHLDDTLDTSSAVRFHVGEVILSSLVRALVIFLLGISLQSVIIFEILVTSASIFQHSNVRLPTSTERVLSWLIVTPSIHWIHHHALRRDTDSNYSNILSLWDRVFGTVSKTERTANLPIGLEGQHDVPLAELLARPLHNRT